MLSPKMQRSIRVNDSQLVMLSERAHFDHSRAGYLHKRAADSAKWQLRYFVLYQNLLFYYDSEACSRPSGVVFLEGCYCERIITTSGGGSKKDLHDKQVCFAISYRRENQRQYELRASNESDCQNWIEAIRDASFNKLLLQKEELEQKHLHLLQIVESEKTAKWQYTQQCEELAFEIKKLRSELNTLKREWKPLASSVYGGAAASFAAAYDTGGAPFGSPSTTGAAAAALAGDGYGGLFSHSAGDSPVIDAIQLQKIKKVQSFFRGWLCRRRWKQIVEQYIKSPHAESMRKRNCLVFRMVEEEEEYLKQLDIVVSCFLRPLRMAVCSQKPPCSHEDINSIFLNVETILFLHQIFYKGLSSRMESWPTLILGDLFNMLIPMLSIYQEYVRNHHYSVQVLTECKQSSAFSVILYKLENKPACHSSQLDTFLMTPMHQIPRYIVTLHELLAHTPHDHVDRKSLMEARQKLEDLSRQIKDEVSETENLRKNLAIERMIVSGCDILLDVNQVYVREGRLVHYFPDKSIAQRIRWSLFKTPDKIAVRYCYLFSNHLILTSRDSNGKLHLVQDIGKIPLVSTKLIEDPSETHPEEDGKPSRRATRRFSSAVGRPSSSCTHTSRTTSGADMRRKGSQTTVCEMQSLQSLISCPQHHDFKLVIDKKVGPAEVVHLYSLTMQEKAAWISDISQCLDNVRFSDFVQNASSDASSVTMPQSVRNDPKLFQDDVDIRFSRSLNSCKVPRVRYATPERLLERLTDLRFLSIDFLNTFLLTYKVFTDGVTVLQALKRVYYDAEPPEAQTSYPTTSDVSLLVSALPAADAGKLSVRPLVVASVARRPSSSPPGVVSSPDATPRRNRFRGELTFCSRSGLGSAFVLPFLAPASPPPPPRLAPSPTPPASPTSTTVTAAPPTLDAFARAFLQPTTDASSNQELSAAQFTDLERNRSLMSPRRSASSVSGYDSETSERDRSSSYDSQAYKPLRRFSSFRKGIPASSISRRSIYEHTIVLRVVSTPHRQNELTSRRLVSSRLVSSRLVSSRLVASRLDSRLQDGEKRADLLSNSAKFAPH
ncbi:hypothetical protein V9T40_010509 [Parthenolecanium corni]|uniref:Ras-specific guanine nucleotide-releasing factor 2 n=1 Tax=Parthenolecanium corni TaxID=536013 RepID=A0AAN9T7J1_9HEMI